MPFSGWYGWGFGFDSNAPEAAGGLTEKDLALLILAVLEDGSAPGYEVALELEERSGGGIHADPELVYPLLQLLADREMISVLDPEAEKKAYQLTDPGREEVRKRRSRIDRLWRRARLGAPEFDEEAFESAMASARVSVREAVREVRDVVDEILEGVLGSRHGGPGNPHRRSHRGPGSGCC